MYASAKRIDRSTARSIANSSFLELVWGLGALTAVGLGLAGYYPRYMVALAPLAFGFALIARSGALASRWPRPDLREQVGIGGDVFGALVCIGLGMIVLLTPIPTIVLTIPALVLGGLLVTDGPIQGELVGASPGHDGFAGVTMSIAGFAAIVASLGALLIADSAFALLLAMTCVGVGHLAATLAAITRFSRMR